ncbi:MAG TPA: helix-turn-helix transcriptional regulator [Bryobacteraceae bacterium]|nr:helix-turn-helix transcriptional regulator [Bryobacteraceae bacterium]
MTFQDAQVRLIAHVRDRIHNGELTERGLARRIGMSQPHVHNVLKGVRSLSPELFDAILKYFQMSLLDLAPSEELEANLRQRAPEQVAEAPFLESPIGPRLPWRDAVDWGSRFPLPFPSRIVPTDLLMARLAADASMSRTLGDADVALLDTAVRRRSEISPDGLYVLSRRGEAALRYIRHGSHGYYLVTDANIDRPREWERLAVAPAGLLEFVKARVRWLGRQQNRDLPMHQRGRFLFDAISR